MKFLLYGILLLFSIQVYADNINQREGLSPSSQLKVNKQLARSYVDDSNTVTDTTNISNGNGSDQTINSFINVRDTPKEVITVVDGDIINICFHCN